MHNCNSFYDIEYIFSPVHRTVVSFFSTHAHKSQPQKKKSFIEKYRWVLQKFIAVAAAASEAEKLEKRAIPRRRPFLNCE